ncbi:hypothetical protein B5P43_15770 [Bacillus sp. SRB_336]|nr:hypothetical protein B5P43_15770 [Bacillus sp. SRB_336]
MKGTNTMEANIRSTPQPLLTQKERYAAKRSADFAEAYEAWDASLPADISGEDWMMARETRVFWD